MTMRSGLGVIAGAVIALVVPLSFRIYAHFLENGILPVEREGSTMGTLTSIALTELLLGPLGIAMAGWAARLRRTSAWVLLFLVSVPVLAVIWFICVATLSGALGSPM
jgi:hypothetical protein